MKKFAYILSILIFGVVLVTGCGRKSTSESGNAKILLSVNAMDDFRQTLVDAAKKEADAKGVQLEVLDAEDNIENQVQHIKKAAKEGYDAILCGPVSADTAVELKANAGDIPVVFFNSCPDDKQLSEGKYVYVGSDESVAGQYQAEYVLNKFSDKDELNVVIFKGPKAHSATAGRTKGVKKALEASGKKINYVFEDNANWDGDTAGKMFELFLKTGSKADCVICNNDGMALGVVEACRKAGIDLNDLPILGVDATADGCAAIEKGDMAFTVYQSGSGQGKAAIDAALKLINGQSLQDIKGATKDGKYVWVPFEKVDSSNVSDYK